MKIIGRNAENAKLKSWYKSGQAEFIAIYGRRRVGKTYLVNTFFDNTFTFDATGIIGGTRTEELDAFYSALVEYGYSGPKPKKWMEATKFISNVRLNLTGRNLVTVTKYKGADPEVDTNIALGGYPATRQFVLGAEITF